MMNPNASATSPVSTDTQGPGAPAFHPQAELELVDPRINELMRTERHRQQEKLILIASESLCPAPVREAVASEFANLYAEGYPSTRMAVWERDRLDWDARHLSFYRRYGDRRYYKGCEYVNAVESEAIARLTELFATEDVPASELYANVQSLSGAAANNAVYEALVPPQATVLGMNLSCGGHLTHGSPVNRSGKHYRIVDYGVDLESGKMDFDAIAKLAAQEKPSLIIAGYSAYPWTIDWARFRKIADDVGAYLLADIAHPAGLVAAREFPSPVGHAHVVSFTTHKTLCGPRGAVILTTDPELARKIDFAVFPGEQGGPHINAIAGKAVAFRLAMQDDFRNLQRRVRQNAAALAKAFAESGFSLAYGGTDTHLCLLNLQKTVTESGEPLAADIAARVLDLVGITCNKNAIAGDTRAANPSGLRFGTTWVSQRGLGTEDMATLAHVVAQTLHAAKAFSVHTNAGKVGRVRLPASALREAKRQVRQLVERRDAGPDLGLFAYPHYEAHGVMTVRRPQLVAFGESQTTMSFGANDVAQSYAATAEEQTRLAGAAVVDTVHAPVIQVEGERADLALQQTLTGDVLALQVGQMSHCWALDAEGQAIGDFLVLRQTDARDVQRYLLVGDAEHTRELTDWLRELSDGMVAFDDDPTRKIDGPIVVEDLAVHHQVAERRVLLTVTGAQASEVLQAAGWQISDDDWTSVSYEQQEVLVLRDRLASVSTFRVIVPLAVAESLASTLLKVAKPVGESAFAAMRTKQQPQATAATARKPFFIGQASLVTNTTTDKREEFVPPAESDELRRTALNQWHRDHTKKFNMVPFAGWDMPVMYTSIVEEHRAVRQAAGLFDVSHMGVLEIRGRGAARFLDLVTTNYPTRLRDGDGHYSYTLDPTGTVMDDLLVYRLQADRFLVVVNASNADKVCHWWQGVAAHRHVIDPSRPSVTVDVDVEVEDLKSPAAGERRKVDLAFQGPQSRRVLEQLCDRDQDRRVLGGLQRFQWGAIRLQGKEILAARTGYTGEDVGYELYVHPDDAVFVWEKILEAGASDGVRPTGLGARDSTRTEAGFPLYGHELAGEFNITPFGAGYSSFVKWHKAFFVGREPLMANEKTRDHRIMRAVVTDTNARPVREGDTVVDGKGRFVGRVTSAAYAGADQILLIYGKRFMVRVGDRIGIFPLPRNKKALQPEPAKDVLQLGDSVLLPIAAQVIPRFMAEAEKRRRSYVR